MEGEQIIKSEESEISENDGSYNHDALKSIKKLAVFFNLATLNFILFLSFIVLGTGYLAFSNQLISRGFSINKLRTSLLETEKQNKELELEVMNLESYMAVDQRIAALEMVKAGEVEYIEAKKESVAMR
ncbi:hypothetical protein COT99_04295 [Candidatus Falkowbacteria bacterium CG10_big_fil_rev_8_21_14_0_10_43_10]|uniref:Uncharacterized protein n=1 Tax=Candidatus Falkowbacteria bacterium CG10_big_fil_rev_8_21_14_0_10_43_10 TaxID=1974567 RepID=A0A2H0V163_9BACT|nr:MAG: hypothetical protein COT99_04295 [Candidatus Falkowbacteria bacterium CG10_big_fil_rev_8_21_14_0_10_43_10]